MKGWNMNGYCVRPGIGVPLEIRDGFDFKGYGLSYNISGESGNSDHFWGYALLLATAGESWASEDLRNSFLGIVNEFAAEWAGKGD